MSYSGTEVNYNPIVERLAVILENSLLIFPKSAPGGKPDADNLLNKIYRYLPPVPENPDVGIGPPLAFVTTPERIVVNMEQMDRDRDAKGFQRAKLEFYIVVITFSEAEGRTKAESSIHNIISAIKTTLYKNLKLCTPVVTPPFDRATRMACTLELFDVSYNLNTDQKSLIARNIVVRPKVDTIFT